MRTLKERSPRVSIGMPVWNGEAFIREGLDSLLGQTFGDFELIISDNASVDGTRAICEEHARRDARIRYTRNDSNTGLQANFAKVLDLATAPYFMWGCHDDRWDPEYIAEMVAVLDSHEAVVLAGGNAGSIDQSGEQRRWFDNVAVYSPKTIPARVRRFVEAPPGGGHATLLYGLMRTPVIKRVGYRPRGKIRNLNRGYYAIDLITLFHLIFEGDFYVTDKTMYWRRDVLPMPRASDGLGDRLRLQRVPRILRSYVETHEYFGDLRAIVREEALDRHVEDALIRTTMREEGRFYRDFTRRLLERRVRRR